MTRALIRRFTRSILLVGMGVSASCAGPVEPPVGPSFAKGKPAADPTVTASDPAYGHEGEVNKVVRISGTGFAPGAQASWERGGVADSKIQVVATQFVSSTELSATITIASDAAIDLYDLSVTNPDRKKGIGYALFEVTTANALPELANRSISSHALAINDAGAIVGRSNGRAFFWTLGAGIEDLGAGQATDIDGSGSRVVGGTATGPGGTPMVWTGGSGSWSGAALTMSCVGSAVGGLVWSVTPDGVLAGGVVLASTSHNKTRPVPVLWQLQPMTCTQLTLPSAFSASGRVTDVNQLGTAAGWASDGGGSSRAVVWDAGGTSSVLAPLVGQASSGAEAISEDGLLVVGLSGSQAAYWVKSGGVWSGAVALSIGAACQSAATSWANDVNGSGLVVGKGCDGGAWYWQVSGGVATPGIRLPGLGPKNASSAEAVNNQSTGGMPWIAGGAGGLAAYWNK